MVTFYLPGLHVGAIPTLGPMFHTQCGLVCGGYCRSFSAEVPGSGSSVSFGAAADGGAAADFVSHSNLRFDPLVFQDLENLGQTYWNCPHMGSSHHRPHIHRLGFLGWWMKEKKPLVASS